MPTTLTIPQVRTVGTLCPSCAVVLVNDDDSHLSAEDADSVRAALAAIRTDEGVASLTTDPLAVDGYFRCSACGDDCLGDAYRLHGWRD